MLTGSVASPLSVKNYESIKNHLFNDESILASKEDKSSITIKETKTNRLKSLIYTGWVTAIIISILSFYFYDQFQKESEQKEKNFETEKTNLKNKLIELNSLNNEAEYLITVFRDTSNQVVPLIGQDVAPKAFAKIYWNKKTKTIYIDAIGLPNPPMGMVYQVWSFKLNPLTPVNLGILNTYKNDGRKFFKVNPSENCEAFGISLEPEGGSETPTLEQLFTLGKV